MKIFMLFAVVGISLAARAVSPSVPQAQTPPSTARDIAIAEGRKYCQGIEELLGRPDAPHRTFAEVRLAEDKLEWRELKGEQELKELNDKDQVSQAALVWSRNNSLVAASFTTLGKSGDWMLFTSYCFRSDGSLAKVSSRLNTTHGNVSVFRDQAFAVDGKLLTKHEDILDLKTHEPKKLGPDDGFIDEETPLCKTVKELPFFSLFGKGGKK
jgi:hypothetical protein